MISEVSLFLSQDGCQVLDNKTVDDAIFGNMVIICILQQYLRSVVSISSASSVIVALWTLTMEKAVAGGT